MALIDTKLLSAVDKDDSNKVIELLNNGADPNVLGANSYSVLMLAVREWQTTYEQKLKMIQSLLEYGADPSYTSPSGYQAITLTNDINIISMLLEAGAKVTTENATQIIYNCCGNGEIRRLFEAKGIKTEWEDSPRQVYYRIREYDGNQLYSEILQESIPILKDCFRQLERYKFYDAECSFASEDECDFYALSRVNEALLLNFQSDKADNNSSKISLEEYKSFWKEIGLKIYTPTDFHPFYCEIHMVQECMGQLEPEFISSRWPCLMFGELLFSRASVCVQAGSDSINKQVAEESTLYWSHIRAGRGCEDLSHGWGSNSQWSTAFRFDYWSNEDLYYNVNHSNNKYEGDDLPQRRQLEVLRHRCFVLTPEVQECWPYKYFSHEKYKTKFHVFTPV